MRFDTPVYFQNVTQGEYDSATGDYFPDKVTESLCYADVTNVGEDTIQLLYGALKQNVQAIRIRGKQKEAPSSVRIGVKTYKVDFVRKLRTKSVYIVSEVQ